MSGLSIEDQKRGVTPLFTITKSVTRPINQIQVDFVSPIESPSKKSRNGSDSNNSCSNFRLKSPNKTTGSGSRRNSDRIEQISSR